jgi:AraC-like DNA-binding protein
MPSHIFVMVLLLLSLYLFESYLVLIDHLSSERILISYPGLYFIGPLLCWYQVSLNGQEVSRSYKIVVLLPGVLAYLMAIPFFIIASLTAEDVGLLELIDESSLTYFQVLSTPLLFPVFTLAWIVFALWCRYNKDWPSQKIEKHLFQIRFRWLGIFLWLLVGYFLCGIAFEISLLLTVQVYSVNFEIVQLFALCIFIHAIGYLLISNPSICHDVKPIYTGKKYEKSALSETMSKALLREITRYMENEKPYLNENISLQSLADKFEVSKHNISQVVNQELNLSFFNLINQYRVMEAKRILTQRQHQRVIDVIFSVGFKNKVSFYRAFKNVTGESFVDYRNQSQIR